MRAPNNRKGFSGWKLTKRPNEIDPFRDSELMLNGYNSSKIMPIIKNGRLPPIVELKRKKKISKLAKSYKSDGANGQ